MDFTQVLQDMIGDLTGAPQPVVVKLFSPDATLLGTWAPQVADALGKITYKRNETGGGHRGRDRRHNQRAGRGFQCESRKRPPKRGSPRTSSRQPLQRSWMANPPPLPS